MKILLITLFICGSIMSGCATVPSESAAIPARPKVPRNPNTTSVAQWAEYYVSIGEAADMAEGKRMAVEMLWSDVEDKDSLFAKLEQRNEDLIKQIDESKK